MLRSRHAIADDVQASGDWVAVHGEASFGVAFAV
jgi:hypothetical protein